MGSKKDKVKISFVGENASNVTGSMTLIEYKDYKILLECGLFQSNNTRRDLEVNGKKLSFKPKNIDYIFVGHSHIDHIGLIPRLYKEGCRAEIITSHETVEFMPLLLKDSAYIMQRDVEMLRKDKKVKKDWQPLYEQEDVEKTISTIRGYDTNCIYELNEHISFKLIPGGHIVGSCQVILYIKKDSGHIVKILYTSDLGNYKLPKPFVKKMELETTANVVIGECTYGDGARSIKNNDRQKDLDKIKSVVLSSCVDRKGKVLIPSFSLDRTQLILKILYDIFGEDEGFDIPIIIDSPLTCKITDVYKYVLDGADKELINKITNWKNVKFIKDVNDSKACVSSQEPMVCISSSGMMNAGRVRNYLKKILPDCRSTLLFCGYSVEGSLAWQIKNYSTQSTISIDRKPYKNQCNIVSLNSFSGHIQHSELLHYYSSINADVVCLVHSNMDDKIKFKYELEKKLSEMGKTTKVSAINKGSSISI